MTEAEIWDDLLMTIWRPGTLPSWTQRWRDRLVTDDQKFDLRYEVLTHSAYFQLASRRLTATVRAALPRPPEIGLIVGDFGVFLYLPGLAEAAVDAHILAVADNVIPAMLNIQRLLDML